MKTIIRLQIAILIFLFFTFQVQAAGIGSIVLLKGTMKIQKQDAFEIYSEPNTTIDLNEQDQIHTGDMTRAKVSMQGQKEVVHLYANSYLTLEKVDDEKSQVALLIGKARFVVEPTVSPLTNLRRNFRMRTSNAFIGVRGTEGVVQTNGTSTSALTISGVVGFGNLANPDEIVELTKNQASRATGDQTPTPAIDVSPEAVEKILTTDEAEEWGDVDFGEPKTPEETAAAPPTPEGDVGDIIDTVDDVQGEVDNARDAVEQSGSSTDAETEKSITFTVTESE